MNKPLEIKSTKVRKELDVAKDRAIAAKAFDVFEAELEDAMQARAVVPELLGRLDSLEKALARPVQVEATTKPPAQPKKQPNKASAPRVLALATVAEARRYSKQVPHEQTLRELYPGDDNRQIRKQAEAILKSSSSPATTVAAGGGAELARFTVGDWIAPLTERSIWGQLAAAGVSIPLDNSRSITMPTRSPTGKGALKASFIQEGGTIPVKEDVLASVTLNPYKLGVISVVSNELINTSSPNILDVVERDILDDLGEGVDGVLLNPANAAIAAIRPASPFNGAANQASTGNTLENIIADIQFLIMSAASVRPRNPVLIMNNHRAQQLRLSYNVNAGNFPLRDEIDAGTLFGLPLFTASHVPLDHVYLIDTADFGYWQTTPQIDVSQSATIVLLDDDGTDPTMADTNAINDTGGSVHVSDAALVTGGPAAVKSMAQTYSTALRMIAPLTWGMMRTGTAAYITGVDW